MISRDIAKNEFTFELFQLTIIIILIIYIFKKNILKRKHLSIVKNLQFYIIQNFGYIFHLY